MPHKHPQVQPCCCLRLPPAVPVVTLQRSTRCLNFMRAGLWKQRGVGHTKRLSSQARCSCCILVEEKSRHHVTTMGSLQVTSSNLNQRPPPSTLPNFNPPTRNAFAAIAAFYTSLPGAAFVALDLLELTGGLELTGLTISGLAKGSYKAPTFWQKPRVNSPTARP